MDNNKLKELIKEVAEIKEVKPVTSGERPADGITEVLYKGKKVKLDKQVNPTLGFKFIKLKSISRPCQLDCGRDVKNQVIESRLVTFPEMHWRTKCVNCSRYLLPDGSLIKGGHEVQAEFNKYFRAKE